MNLVAWRAEQLREQHIVEQLRALPIGDTAGEPITITLTGGDGVQRKVTVRPQVRFSDAGGVRINPAVLRARQQWTGKQPEKKDDKEEQGA